MICRRPVLFALCCVLLVPSYVTSDEPKQTESSEKDRDEKRGLDHTKDEDYDGPELYPSKGIITLDGRPLANATITCANSRVACSCQSDVDGKWEMMTFYKSNFYIGMPVGTFTVIVDKRTKPDIGIEEPSDDASKAEIRVYQIAMEAYAEMHGGVPQEVPAKYSRPTKSGLKIHVEEGGSTDVEIALVSVKPQYDESELGPLQIASGTITLDGKPLRGALIEIANEKVSAKCISDKNGKWVMKMILEDAEVDGVPVGHYLMTVKTPGTVDVGIPTLEKSATDKERRVYWKKVEKKIREDGGLKSPLPPNYGSTRTSGLKIDVLQGGKTDYRIELTSDD